MSLNVAAVAQAVTDTVPSVPFINWQYIYCWLVSWFGKRCTEAGLVVDVPSVSDVTNAATSTASAAADAAGQVSTSFWSWLWPFQSGATSAASAAEHVGFWASLAATIPGPIKAVFLGIASVLSFLWSAFSVLSYTVSGILGIALIAACVMLALLRIKEWSAYGTLPPRPLGHSRGWSRWQDMLDAAMSAEPKRWREGIVAADQMLGELLTRLGYFGEHTSEQLRSVPEGAFITLPQAWEAHRIRNFVVQRSSDFILTQREAFRVMKLYEQVFEEFDFI